MTRLFVIVFVSVSVLSCRAEYEVFSPIFKCAPRLSSPYGVCSHINSKGVKYDYDTRKQELALIDSVGIEWVRTDFYWWQLQRGRVGTYNYQLYDSMMTSVRDGQKKLLGILVPPQNKKEYGEWGKYLDNVVARYRSHVHCWELINEADLRSKNPIWSWFTAKNYVDLLKQGHDIIKKKQHQSKILFSGISNIDSGFLDSVFSANVGGYFDIMNVHRYSPRSNEPETFIKYYERLGAKMEKYKLRKPVWLTECGCPTAQGWSTEQTQAERLPRIFLVSFALGVEKVFWYNFRSNELDPNDKECHFGVCHRDYTPKPAYYAYKNLIRMCPYKSTRPQLSRHGNVYLAQWKRPDGKKVYSVWTSKGQERVGVRVKGGYSCYNLFGHPVQDAVAGNAIEVSSSVVYIVGNKDLKLEIYD